MFELVEVDLHQLFGIDLDALPDRSWRWLRARITALTTDPGTRVFKATRKGR